MPIKSILFTFILLISLVYIPKAKAMGGIWVLEVRYEWKGVTQTGFIQASSWAEEFDTLIGLDSLFDQKLRHVYTGWDSIIIYDQIENRERIAKHATFPIHSFMLDQSSGHEYPIKDISELSLIKVWRRIEYVINVLTPINDSDTTWISGPSTIEYPIGEEIGCRLEVHVYSHSKEHAPLVLEFASLYSVDPSLLTLKMEEDKLRLLEKLKAKHVVVVELCGC